MSCWESNGYGKVVDPFWDNKEKSGGSSDSAKRSDIATEFSATTSYTAGCYVYHEGKLYIFNVDHAAGAWDPTDVALANVTDEITSNKAAIDALEDKVVANPTGQTTATLTSLEVDGTKYAVSGGGGGGGMLEVANLSVGVTGLGNERESYDYLAPSGSEIDVTGHATIAIDVIPDPSNYFVYNFSKTINFNDANFVSGDLDTIVLFEELGYDIGGHQSERYALQVQLDVVPQAGETGHILICEIHAKVMLWDNNAWTEVISAAKSLNSATGYARIGVYK